MPRGQKRAVGSRRKAPNGYWYEQTADRGQVLVHWLVMEEKLGRKINPAVERVCIIDGNKDNLSPDNIEVRPKHVATKAATRARIEARIEELQAQLEEEDDEGPIAEGA